MPGVVSVQPRTGGGLIDSVMKGLSIARDVYGIQQSSAQTDLLTQKTEQEKTAFDQAQSGQLPQAEKVAGARFGSYSDQPSDGSVLFNFVGDKNPTYYTPFKDSALVKAVDPNTGSPVFQYISRGDGPVEAYEPPKEPKQATPHITALGQDQDGNMVTLDTTTGATNTVPMGGAITKIGANGKPVDPDKQAKVYTELTNKVMTPRGNQNVQQAQINLRNIQSAQDLINQYSGNLDQMTPQDYGLLTTELGKIAHGGVASEHTQNTIAASTLKSQWDGLMQKVGGQPTGADLGAFIQNNQKYLSNLKDINQGEVNNYVQGIYNGYKDRLTPEQQAMFQSEHADAFKGRGQPARGGAVAAAAPGGGIVGTAQAAPAAAAGAHPQDAEAVAWANQNLMSPDAAKATMARQILQVNGAQ